MGENQLNQILNEIISFINAVRENAPKEIVDNHIISIKEHYSKILHDNKADNFYYRIKHEFNDDLELYLLLMSILYSINKDGASLKEIGRVLCEEDIDLFVALNVRTQIESAVFSNFGLKDMYPLRREIHKRLLYRMEDILQTNLPLINWTERDELVVIVTNQLLSELHAPTRIVLEICHCLQQDLGYKVLLVVAPEEMEYNRMEQFWYNPIALNYVEEYNGNFRVGYKEKTIQGYQILINRANLDAMKGLLSQIADLKPAFAWYIGGCNLFADLMRSFTTVMSMPCSDGYAVSEAQIMLSYMNSGSDDVKSSEAYSIARGQALLHMTLDFPIPRSSNKYTRDQFSIPEDSFAITVVGNRLDEEITAEFLDILNKILEISTNVVLIFIGVFHTINEKLGDAVQSRRVFNLGYQEDLTDVLSLMDLFLNPVRRGGGGGALRALEVGVPVITMDYCDVANAVGKEFICDNLDEMVRLTEKYIRDKEFYLRQGYIAENKRKNIVDLKEEIALLLREIERISKYGGCI